VETQEAAEAEPESNEVLRKEIAALEDGAAVVVDEAAEMGALDLVIGPIADIGPIVKIGDDQFHRGISPDPPEGLLGQGPLALAGHVQPVEVPVQGGPGDLLGLDHFLGDEDLEDGPGGTPWALLTELHGLVEDGLGEGPKGPPVLAWPGLESQEATLPVEGEPAPEGGQGNPDLAPVRIPVRRGSHFLEHGNHAFVLRLQGGGDNVVPKGGDGEGTVIEGGHGPNLPPGPEHLGLHRRGAFGQHGDQPVAVELAAQKSTQAGPLLQWNAVVPVQPRQPLEQQNQAPDQGGPILPSGLGCGRGRIEVLPPRLKHWGWHPGWVVPPTDLEQHGQFCQPADPSQPAIQRPGIALPQLRDRNHGGPFDGQQFEYRRNRHRRRKRAIRISLGLVKGRAPGVTFRVEATGPAPPWSLHPGQPIRGQGRLPLHAAPAIPPAWARTQAARRWPNFLLATGTAGETIHDEPPGCVKTVVGLRNRYRLNVGGSLSTASWADSKELPRYRLPAMESAKGPAGPWLPPRRFLPALRPGGPCSPGSQCVP